MALSTIIKQTCPAIDKETGKVCGKIAVELTRVPLGNDFLITLECGHLVTEGRLGSADDLYTSIVSSDGKRLMPYQIEGVKRIEEANARAILADMQGLGKTVQALATIKLHADILLPAVIFVPATVKMQWHHEVVRWCGLEGFRCQVISHGKEFCAPGFQIYIVTYEMAKNDNIWQYVKDDIKFVILDECQRVKNHLSERAKAVQRLCKNVPHILPMSGTPIKNNAGEYFTVLNLVQPRRYPNYSRFIEQECDSYHNGWGYKVGGLKNPDKFAQDTKDFIIRRTKDEVLKDLPEFSRRFFHVEMDGKVKAAYIALIKELDDILYDDDMNAMDKGAAKIAIMSKMRHITGLSKVPAVAEQIRDFLESQPWDRKLTVFTHHQDVMELLAVECQDFLTELGLAKPLLMKGTLSADERYKLALRFREDEKARVMIASTLAAGEGLNLQFCSDAIMMERQWNPANEEQAEARFHRYGQKNAVVVNYSIVSETIDEYFTELVEQKRAIVAGALDNKEIQWDQNSLMSDLAMILVTKGKKAWKL
jgi:SWI/SNF-related matrix-associated actin-dependent regulator of chromatin subfamily A-like protein 1